MSGPARRLVVNADDLGLHPALDAGILRAHREGVVTSATLLATGTHAPDAAECSACGSKYRRDAGGALLRE